MIYERFRTDETSAKLTWIDGASGPLRRGPATAMGPATDVAAGQSRPPTSGGHDPSGQVIQGRSFLGPAGVLRYPSTSLLRATPADDSLVQRSASDGRARAIELPPLAECRAHFDRIFKIPQDWNEPTEDDFDFG